MLGCGSSSFRRSRPGAIALVVVALAGCAWAQPHFDAGQTSNNAFETAIGVGTVARLQRSWSVPAPQTNDDFGDLVVGGGRVYAPRRGAVDAFDAVTGTLRWSAPAQPPQSGGSVFGSVTGFAPGLGAHGLLFVTQANIGSPFDPRSTGWTTALDASSGQVVWSRPEGWNGGVLVGDVVFAMANRHVGDASDFRGTIAFDALTGAERFRVAGFSALAAADGTVYGSVAGGVAALPASGCAAARCVPVWTATYSGGTWSGQGSIAVAGGSLYLAGIYGLEVFASAGCGHAMCNATWKATGSYGGIAVAGDRLFVNDDWLHGEGPNVLHVFDARGCGAATCTQLWGSATARNYKNPTVANGLVYLSARGSPTEAWRTSGCGTPVCAPVWSTTDALVTPASAIVINGRLLVSGSGIQTYVVP